MPFVAVKTMTRYCYELPPSALESQACVVYLPPAGLGTLCYATAIANVNARRTMLRLTIVMLIPRHPAYGSLCQTHSSSSGIR